MKKNIIIFAVSILSLGMLSSCGGDGSREGSGRDMNEQRTMQNKDNKADQDGRQRTDTLMQTAQYACPMHPEVTSAEAGKCSKCGMDLVSKK